MRKQLHIKQIDIADQLMDNCGMPRYSELAEALLSIQASMNMLVHPGLENPRRVAANVLRHYLDPKPDGIDTATCPPPVPMGGDHAMEDELQETLSDDAFDTDSQPPKLTVTVDTRDPRDIRAGHRRMVAFWDNHRKNGGS